MAKEENGIGLTLLLSYTRNSMRMAATRAPAGVAWRASSSSSNSIFAIAYLYRRSAHAIIAAYSMRAPPVS